MTERTRALKRKKQRLKVMSEMEYDPESFKKRQESLKKMVDDAVEEIDWKMLEKHLGSDSHGSVYNDLQASRNSTRASLELMLNPFNWAARWSFYMYNHYIYTKPCTSHQPPVVDSLNLDHQRMPKIAPMGHHEAVNDKLELVARKSMPEIGARGSCESMGHAYVRNSFQLRMPKMAGMAPKGSLVGLGLVAGYASWRSNKPVR